MNALEMLGGFTASAGPIGGADAGGTVETGDGDVAGGFDALVAKALGVDAGDVPELTAGDNEEADPAEPGLDLSVMLAMAGLAPFQVVAPQAVDPAAASDAVSEGGLDPAVSVAGPAVAGMTLDTVPCTLVPGGNPIESSSVSAGEPASAGDGVPADPTPRPDGAAVETSNAVPVAAAPTKGDAAIQPEDVGPQDAAVGAAPATGVPSGPAAAVSIHHALHSRRTPAARAGGGEAVPLDEAWRQATSVVRAVLSEANAPEVATPVPTQAAVHAPGVVARHGTDAVQNAKPAEAAATVDIAIAASGGVVASAEASGQSGHFDQRGEPGAGEPAAAPPVALSGARAEAAIQAFSSLSMDTAGRTGGTADPAAVPVHGSAPAVTPQESAQNVNAMVRAVRMHLTDGGGEARLQLNPEHLGPVTLTVRVEQGRVAAHIQAETADASRWIETHQSNLRSALEDQGLDVKELVVTTDPDGQRERDQPRQQPSKARGQRRNAGGQTPTFEILA